MSGRYYNPNRVLAPFVAVVLLEPFAQPLHLDADNAVGFGIEVWRSPERLRCDGIFFDAVEVSGKGLFDDKLEKQSRGVRPGKRNTVQDLFNGRASSVMRSFSRAWHSAVTGRLLLIHPRLDSTPRVNGIQDATALKVTRKKVAQT